MDRPPYLAARLETFAVLHMSRHFRGCVGLFGQGDPNPRLVRRQTRGHSCSPRVFRSPSWRPQGSCPPRRTYVRVMSPRRSQDMWTGGSEGMSWFLIWRRRFRVYHRRAPNRANLHRGALGEERRDVLEPTGRRQRARAARQVVALQRLCAALLLMLSWRSSCPSAGAR